MRNKYPRPKFRIGEIVIYDVPNHPDYGALGIVRTVYNANIAEGYIGSEHEYDVEINNTWDPIRPCYERNLMKVK